MAIWCLCISDYLKKVEEIQHPQDLNGHPWIDFGSVRKTGVTISTSDQRTYYLEPMKVDSKSDNLVLQIDSIANGHGMGLLPDPIAAGYSKHHPNQFNACLNGKQRQRIFIIMFKRVGSKTLAGAAGFD